MTDVNENNHNDPDANYSCDVIPLPPQSMTMATTWHHDSTTTVINDGTTTTINDSYHGHKH
ncbi:hypothetical protein SCLCIDRAFT_1219320 [Scleroderma citrinum Foug A]|uniref:Uncharacterized protein n=1 Tax=Scleroderma citrinum Foug A TaxID=1036808 RepID=A0A0C3DN51_9AGAM|nr:hypothetical protein SCLCIDRAFT_1219320 [Scleroderma citrinum Foug A]